MKEVWKHIEGTLGCYSVSTFGRIKRNDKGNILKMRKNKDGYFIVNLSCNGTRVTKQVHRIVAKTFLGAPPMGCDVVNHKDENKTNNHIDNLEWCSVEYNNNYGSRNGNFKIKVAMCNPITDDTIYVFNSMYEAFKKTGVNFGAISNVIKGKGRRAGGYKWIKI